MKTLPRILLVEDNLKDAELTIEALQENHLANEILHLRDGAEALDYVYRRGAYEGRSNGHPTLVLLDLKMPRLDGIEVLRQMKGDPELKVIPVVVMTSSREDRDLHACYQLGVNAYVVKPVNFADFMEAVRNVGGFWALINEPPPGLVPPQ